MQQSELALFAQEFRRALAPLFVDLGRAHECLGPAGTGLALAFDPGELRGGLAALGDELAELATRVERERASVIVFGPSKAGKSTLLDALAGARVSEVSILPGYPCLLRAAHAREEVVALQRFDGSFETLADPGSLRVVLQRAQGELVASVRAARARGEAFDPARHLLSAVRRVQRALPAEPLARAALELVESPSVHAPLFPSYAEMLIGEPDHARAAVFVLRAAQLADEAAFDGIEELLGTFERVVLVLNLDERARELSRAGELVASLEREDPARLIAAFEELSTCEPLVRALRAGRVPVLALDLLEAARARLHGAEGGTGGSARARFEDLERELSGALDDHPALHALVHSALRRAGELAGELAELAETPGLSELVRQRDAAESARAALASVRAALERLAGRARALWESEDLFDGLRARLASLCGVRAAELARALEAPLTRALEDWFADGTSLAELLDTRLAPRLEAARAELVRAAERALREELKRASGTDVLSATARADLEQARVPLAELFAPCLARVRAAPEPVELRPLDVEAIPVRPKLGQRLTWRAASEVRRQLFGAPEAPARPLTSAEKARRLGSEARTAMQRSLVQRARGILAEEARRAARALDEALLTAFTDELAARVARELERLSEPMCEREARVAELSALAKALGGLAPASTRVRLALAELAERFEPGTELVPAARATRASPALREPAPALE